MCFSVRCTAALFFQLIGASSFAPAGEPSATSNQSTQTQFAITQEVCNARRHPAYQVFVAQMSLPAITAITNQTLSVGGLTLGLSKADTIRLEEKNALTQRLQIPGEFFTALVQKLSANAQASGEELANQLRTSVLDYKYLSKKWAQYHPQTGGESVKTEALKCLQAADLERAWQLFMDLKKPAPPTGLKIIDGSTITTAR